MRIGLCVPMNTAWTAAADGLAISLGDEAEIVRGVEPCLAEFRDLDAVVANIVDRAYYEKAERLKAIFVPFVGVNHLPADLILERGISVFNCHGNAESVAEKALSMALAGFGRLVEYHNDLRDEIWHGFWVGKGREDFWHSMFRRRCAILGVGAIGEALARLLKAFDCEVIGYRRRADAKRPEHFDEVTTDLLSAVSGAEIVFVALPLTDATRGVVGRAELEAMRGAFLVNVGRGEVVDEAALYEALRDGALSGAGLDVWYTYPQGGSTVGAPSRFPIHRLPNVVLSPHVGGSTYEAVDMNVVQTSRNIELWARTGDAEHRVDLRASY
ncbi:MAG: NAD(P)-binding domain-containing protein [Spirochaetes bacterium]|nr:NAD(P)-binding domain-containing protein [Spirochaetota bacterium]